MNKSRLFIFASSNSFLTLPPVKQFFNYLFPIINTFTINSTIHTYENFLKKSTFHKNVNIYKNNRHYNDQNIVDKILKHLKIIWFFVFNFFIIKKKYSTIYIYSFELFIIWLAIKLKSPHCKIIYHQFEMIIPDSLNKLDKFYLNSIKKNIASIDLVILPEENRKIFFARIVSSINNDQMFILPNTNNNEFKSIDNSTQEKNKVRVTHIGAIGIDHHIDSYIKAIKLMCEEKYEFWFVGLISEEVIKLFEPLINKNIVFTGQLKHCDLQKIYRETDIGVILYKDVSLNHRYCAPNKLYEYWSYGIPVVGDILPGLRTVFKYDVLGELIDMNYPELFFKTFERLDRLKVEKRNMVKQIFNDSFRLDNYLEKLNEKLEFKNL